MARSKSRRAKRRKTKSARKTARRGGRRAKSAKKAKRTARKGTARKGPARKRKSAARPRKRTTAEGMHRALALKQKAEAREHKEHPQPAHNWPTQIPQETPPDTIPENPREQGDVANIIQNTTNRRAG
jgi:hypothetical protein